MGGHWESAVDEHWHKMAAVERSSQSLILRDWDQNPVICVNDVAGHDFHLFLFFSLTSYGLMKIH